MSLRRLLPTNKSLGEVEILEESVSLIVKLQQSLLEKIRREGVPDLLQAAGLASGTEVDIKRMQEAMMMAMPTLRRIPQVQDD